MTDVRPELRTVLHVPDRRRPATCVATALVTEVHDCTRCDSYLGIDFTTDTGRRVVTEMHEAYRQPVPRVGDSVEVRYDERDPGLMRRLPRWADREKHHEPARRRWEDRRP